MQPTLTDVHVNVPLTTMSVGYQQTGGYVASEVFPTVHSQEKSNSYYIYNRADFLRSMAEELGPGQEAAGGNYRLATADFNVRVFAVKRLVDDMIRANTSSPLDMDRDAMIFVTHQLMLKRDIAWATAYFTSGVWAIDADVTSGTYGNGRWSAGGSTPIKDVRNQMRAIKRKTGKKPTCLTLGSDAWDYLQDHPDFLDRVSFGQPGAPSTVTPQLLAQILGLQKVVIAEAIKTTSAKSSAVTDPNNETYDFILGKHALLTYSPPSASLMEASAGYTFVWDGFFGANAEGSRILKMRDDPKHSDVIEGQQGWDMKVVCPELGAFFPDVVA